MDFTKKKLTLLTCVLACLIVITAMLNLIPEKSEEQTQVFYLQNKELNDVERIDIKNTHGNYSVWREEGGYIIEDLPAHSINIEYLEMLLKESSKIEYLDSVKNGEDLTPYGLDSPQAEVSVKYTDGTEENLLIGGSEPLSEGRYFMRQGGREIYLMDNSRSIRFTMPIEKYIDYIIIPPRVEPAVLTAMGDITFEGDAFPTPVTIKAVYNGDEETQRQGASFGVTTHIITTPYLRGIDQTQATAIFGSLTGMVSDGVLAYNATEEQLKAFGLDNPYLTVNFTYNNGKDAPPVDYTVKVAKYEGGEIMTKNDEGIVYKISQAPFTSATYEKLVSKRFLSPLIIDVAQVDIAYGDENYTFALSGEKNTDLTVTQKGKEVDVAKFRKLFSSLVAIDHDGQKLEGQSTTGDPLLTLTYTYKDEKKPKDTLQFYKGDVRKNNVALNGVMEFATNEKYILDIKEQINGLNS